MAGNYRDPHQEAIRQAAYQRQGDQAVVRSEQDQLSQRLQGSIRQDIYRLAHVDQVAAISLCLDMLRGLTIPDRDQTITRQSPDTT